MSSSHGMRRRLRPSTMFAALRRLGSPAESLWLAGFVALLVALEVVGRRSPSDAWDLFAVGALVTASALTALRHRREPLPWLRGPAARLVALRTWVREHWVEVGVDLRGAPALPRRLPTAPLGLAALVVTLVAFTYVPGVAGAGTIGALRALLAERLYVAWLATLTLLWAAGLAQLVLYVVLPLLLIHDACVGRFRGPGRRRLRPELLASSAYVGALIAVSLVVPVGAARTGVGALMLAPLLLLWPGVPRVEMLWRARGGGPIRAFDSRWDMALDHALFCGVLALTARLCVPSALADTPISTGLGACLAWFGGAGHLALISHLVLFLGNARRHDPRRPAWRSLRLEGQISGRSLARIAEALRGQRWRVRVGNDPRAAERPCEVTAFVEEDAPERDPRFEPWSSTFPPGALLSEEMRWRMRRRHEIHCRRALLRGLEFLLKRAARRDFQCGTGFWINPHQWFTVGLRRDTDEEDPDASEGNLVDAIIGPPWHAVLPHAARHHLHDVLRALDVDLIYLEDGVGFRGLRRSLRRMFDIHDRHAGQRLLEEHHFQAVHGVSAVLIDHELGSPFQRESYPEPSYDDLARARILHLFRERRADGDPDEAPVDVEGVGTPVGIA